ncbi:NAD(P)/FAD-dependent oxidoreductase [Pseudoteredinibacter isoporae]|uniref:Glycine/D-amino acid oxidase-like deaminating enzyme n=1 Tax=Pseudoteredinibacter isoporae TaxID=570281 RepID=A0A7X0MVL3_9GAMM|nr:FAD-binding oxidoreductase [Pseudoteredinibacter isoporae]MBB6521836.1 glycine/D-amino acid oxidase-like deaminating enzyme [Pseudoteredinibacter isoporae]NHO87380.1 FAD-binding oxidoreductase [Pseudoteredinibacter isoporae]NIB23204.1 FAD-binding oxidoreductase [Pseudoteredinibacter isoporae]
MPSTVQESMAANHSFWQHKYGNYQAEPTLPAGDYSADIVIVGGGFTGLTTAREYCRENSNARVMLLEAREIGFGASGRNGGFNMTLFGLEPEVTELFWGKDRTQKAQQYMKKAVNFVRDLVEREQLDSDYEHTGMWRLAYSTAQEKRLQKTYQLLCELMGKEDYQYLNHEAVQKRLNAPNVRAAIVEPGTGIFDPCKHVRELKRLALESGADVYENTAVTELNRHSDHIQIKTANASIRADKVVLAVNAWGHAFDAEKNLRNKQRPIWTYQIVTEPLTEKEWKDIRWEGRMSIEDNRNLVHYTRITKCGRITLGGGRVNSDFGTKMDQWHCEKSWQQLEKHLHWLFPTLKNKAIHYKWGGAVSVNLNMTPEISYLGDERIIQASGCMGHGVSLTQLNGRLITDLLQNKQSELSEFWIVNRRAIPMPPGNLLSYLGGNVISQTLNAMDWWQERELEKP